MSMRKPTLYDVYFLRASQVTTDEDLDLLSDSNSITFGGARHTMVTVNDIEIELGYLPDGLEDYESNDLVDLES